VDSLCAEAEQSGDLRSVLGSAVDHEIEMNSRSFLDRCGRAVHSDTRSDSVGRDQDREVVFGGRKRNSFVAEDLGPERSRPFDIVGAQDDRSKPQHEDESRAVMRIELHAYQRTVAWRRPERERHLGAR